MATLLTPISIQVPLVDPETGHPTPYFQRILQQLLKEKAVTDELAESAVQGSRQIISGGGLTGGGDLSADRTLAVGAGTGITVNADDVAIDSTYLDERIRDVIGAALTAGSNVTITVDDTLNTITIAASGGGGGSGGSTVIGTTVVAVAAPSITFSAIPATYKDLVIHGQVRSTIAAGNDLLRMQFNGDTGANYDWERDSRFGAGGNAFASTYLEIAAPTGATSPANVGGTFTMEINNYAATVFHKMVRGSSDYMLAASAGNFLRFLNIGRWRSTAAVTSITLSLPASNFVVGSTVTLYGRG